MGVINPNDFDVFQVSTDSTSANAVDIKDRIVGDVVIDNGADWVENTHSNDDLKQYTRGVDSPTITFPVESDGGANKSIAILFGDDTGERYFKWSITDTGTTGIQWTGQCIIDSSEMNKALDKTNRMPIVLRVTQRTRSTTVS